MSLNKETLDLMAKEGKREAYKYLDKFLTLKKNTDFIKLNTIDSTYLTFFVKYGLFGFGVIILFFRVLLIHVKDFLVRKALIIFYLVLFITTSTLYQSGAILQILFINMFIISLYHEDTADT